MRVPALDRPLTSSSSTPDNFIRAETTLYFSRIVADNGFGKFTSTVN